MIIRKINVIIKKHYELIAYLFFGFCTVVINTLTYYLLSLKMDELIANTIAFFVAVMFAYIVNTKFVFRNTFTKANFTKFWAMRIGTLLIDNGGMFILILIGLNDLIAKCFVNVVIIVLNYIFSKFIIYKKEGDKQ